MDITRLRLFHFPGSRSARVRWALLECWGDGFELETLQLLEGEQHRPEFLAMNPNHAVPVLEIVRRNGLIQHMIESTAIVQWLADALPDAGLAPRPGPSTERADYLQTLHFGGSTMDALLWSVRLHRDLLPGADADTRVIERSLETLTREIEPQLRARLEGTPFICGERFSAADIVIGHNIRWARAYGLLSDKVFDAYVKRLHARPAFIQAFSDLNPPP